MKQFKFIMIFQSKTVAIGTASATMSYEFQRTFWNTTAYAPSSKGDCLSGKFITLDDLLSLPVGGDAGWLVTRKGEMFRMYMERLEDVDD